MNTETTVVSTDGAAAPAETVATAATDTVKAPESVTTDTTATDAAEPGKTEGEKKAKPRNVVSELAFEKRQLKRENTELLKRLDEIEKRIQPKEPVKPRLADFDSDTAYEAAMDQYHLTRRDYDSKQASEKETQERAARQKQEVQLKATQKFVADIQKEKANYQDIDTVMADPTFTAIVNDMPADLVHLIQTSDKNVALAYHLGTNLDVAERIASLPPVQAARELALLESRLEIPKPKTVTTAPDPVKPANGASVNTKKPADMNQKEFEEWRNQHKASRR